MLRYVLALGMWGFILAGALLLSQPIKNPLGYNSHYLLLKLY